ncbi:hypothetical protein [Angustibacter aerolatus]|uniref:DUF3309 domain-containing protein n=1 Tax=Angustibacter aerolatus TaxID=1162965 RepID=A0ABQ6JMW2_9ACTN|nr:hypothetical protein GCM10025868_33550 [Angustibacter aerolatus]
MSHDPATPASRRPVLALVGVLLLGVGAVWFGQGTGWIGGSAMTGVTTWAVVGPIVAVVGLVLLGLGLRRR